MIDFDEIRVKADEFGIDTSNVQRDYVFGWLIDGVARDEDLGGRLALKGGNALRKAYVPATRFSDDLDYSTPGDINPQTLLDRLNAVCAAASERSGLDFVLERNRFIGEPQLLGDDRVVHKLRLYFRDFTGTTQEMVLKVRVDVTEFDQLVLPTVERPLIHPYSDAGLCEGPLRVVAVEEVLADKLRALLQRQYSQDLFDFVFAVFVSRDLAIDRVAVIRTFLRKSLFAGAPRTARSMLLQLPFELMRQFWGRLVLPKVSLLRFDDAVSRFTDELIGLFAPFGESEMRATGYFSAEFRSRILEAHSQSLLLRMTYDGVSRMIEPYELVFKRRKDGMAREYFYGNDRTGGRSSGPGVKSFWPEKIQRLEVSDEPYEPSRRSGLREDGTATEGTFAGRHGPVGRATRRRPAASGVTYKVQCSACGKTFTRKTPSTALNAHKNGYGTRCFGRHGFRVF